MLEEQEGRRKKGVRWREGQDRRGLRDISRVIIRHQTGESRLRSQTKADLNIKGKQTSSESFKRLKKLEWIKRLKKSQINLWKIVKTAVPAPSVAIRKATSKQTGGL